MIHIQSGAIDPEIGARYRVEVRSDEFGAYTFEGRLSEVSTIERSAYSGNPGFDFLSFVEVLDVKDGELVALDGGGRGARDFTIATMTKLA